jgi:hypothetical protein
MVQRGLSSFILTVNTFSNMHAVEFWFEHCSNSDQQATIEQEARRRIPPNAFNIEVSSTTTWSRKNQGMFITWVIVTYDIMESLHQDGRQTTS